MYSTTGELCLKSPDFFQKPIQILFSDEGHGIPKDHLPFIFDRFYRVPDHPDKAGTGLGLFICRRIIEAHHGKIWAESEEEKGTCFIIQLPAQQLKQNILQRP